MTVQQLIQFLQTVQNKQLQVRVPQNGLLMLLGEVKASYIVEGKTDEDYPSTGWVEANPTEFTKEGGVKLPTAAALILWPGDE